MDLFGRSNLTTNTLPYMHRNARSRQITAREIKKVYVEEITRFLPRGVDRDEYLRKVMP
jgi:hypothetical protein